MTQLFANNAASELASAVASGAVSLTLKAGGGALFPAPTVDDFFLVTLYQKVGQDETNHEIVKCTARTGDVLTVVRAQEGTTAQAFAAQTPVELRVTAAWAETVGRINLLRSARTSNAALVKGDIGTLIDVTSGTFTQTFAAAATLGNGWWCYLHNSGTGVITLDPNGSETIDGGSIYDLSSGHAAFVQCDGSGLRVVYDICLTQTRHSIFSTNAALKTGISVLENIANVPIISNLLTSAQTGSITQNGSNFVAGSSLGNGAATMSSVSSSADGRTWTLRTMPSTQAWCVASDGAGFMALGSAVTNSAYSASGTSWAAATALPSAPPYGVKFVGKSGVYIVRGSASATTLYRTDNNGTSWSTETALTAGLTGFYVCGGLFVANVNATSSTYDTSSTGLTGSWTNRSLPGSANRMAPDYDGSLVAHNTTSGAWWRSTDAINWTLQTSALAFPASGVKTINGTPFSGATSAIGAASLHNGAWVVRQIPVSTTGSVFAKIGNVIVDTQSLFDHSASDAPTAIFEG